LGIPQPALTLDMGASTNVEQLSFEYDALAFKKVAGQVQDRTTAQTRSVKASRSQQMPPLAKRNALKVQGSQDVRQVLPGAIAGLTKAQAGAIAQGTVNRSSDQVVTGKGELAVVRYGHLLKARHLVGVRGCGDSYNGLYMVKQVTHLIQRGEYRQQFTLAREGLDASLPVVRP
ncbi:MAG: hypothetical protein WBA76_16950, partial [Phormidesmis sp.]